ncbi:sensor histidine kinase [[Clostridium] dakarense]|uniref:sensor histidine kinase n=1 Tax=Faecalimicrobium dakarense TaxID=1301100 RepID=UPI001FA76F34|nr:HAMP domain-containing sensor histidine kinase [[Clostridium] dakarense]
MLARLFFIKNEIKNITKQLNNHNSLKSRKKIDIKLFDKDIENLAERINKNISISNELQVNHMKSQDELKRTIANISHDLRTPLTSILGYVQMMKNENIDKNKKKEYVDIIENRARDLQNLLNDFFNLSLLESSDYKLNLEYINLNNILCDELAGFYEYFVSKGINPNIDIPDKDIMIIGDISATKRVLENLMINIAKHSND